MIDQGKRAEGSPVIITPEDEKISMEKVSLRDHEYNEDWLQEQIYQNPELLPMEKFNNSFSPLIPLGREIRTQSGPLDNLYVSKEGYPTLVEVKLWKNPEARRKAIAQAIDYVKDISQWDFEALDQKVKGNSYSDNNNGILDLVADFTRETSGEEFTEEERINFQDQLNKNLKQGRFLILIVGDGIKENVEDMTDFLNKTPQLLFTFGLVEIKIYRFEINGQKYRTIFPVVPFRTMEYRRSYIEVNIDVVKENENINLNVDTNVEVETAPEEQNSTRGGSRRITLDEEEYLSVLKENVSADLFDYIKNDFLPWANQEMDDISWGSSSFTIREKGKEFFGYTPSICSIHKDGTLKINYGYLMRSVGPNMLEEFHQQLMEIPEFAEVIRSQGYEKQLFGPEDELEGSGISIDLKSIFNEATNGEKESVFEQFKEKLLDLRDSIEQELDIS